MATHYRDTTKAASARRIPPDPGRDRGWSSARMWRWLLPRERERVNVLGGYLSMWEPALPPRGAVRA
jgi:hypothetical protein